MGRLVCVNGIPNTYRLGHVLEVLSNAEMIAHCDYSECVRAQNGCADKPMFRVSFKLRSAYLATIIKELKLVGVGEMFGEIDVMATLCSTEQLPKAESSKKKARKRWRFCPSALDRRSTLEIHTGIVESSHINFDHVRRRNTLCAFKLIIAGLIIS